MALLLLLQLSGARARGQSPTPHPIDLTGSADPQQYSFLSPLLKDAEVVSLAESIHMTHEFPLVRIGMVRWMNQHLGFAMLAIEGSPEDLWVSQDAFLRDPSNLTQSTSGLFGVWNTAEMQQLFGYEAATWQTSHPLYITAYDIQPGTGRDSRGVLVFQLLAQRLAQYAPPPPGFDATAWSRNLTPLTDVCSQFKADDEEKITQAIALLQEWIDRAAPNVQNAFPNLPHAAALHLVPENLRASLALCKGVSSSNDSGAGIYKTTRDTNATQFALRLKEAAPQHKLILWAHVSHLSYDAEASNTSVGEILHSSLGPRLYTIGAFAESGGAIMLFSDWKDIVGYGRIWGVSTALKQALDPGCPSICFFDLRGVGPGSPLSQRRHVWLEKLPVPPIALSRDFDGIIWVRNVHPPQMPLRTLLSYCSPRYRWTLATLLFLFLCFAAMLTLSIRNRRKAAR